MEQLLSNGNLARLHCIEQGAFLIGFVHSLFWDDYVKPGGFSSQVTDSYSSSLEVTQVSKDVFIMRGLRLVNKPCVVDL